MAWETIANWIKLNPLFLVVGALTTTFGVVTSASTAVPVVLKTFNIPDCYSYADVYRGPWSKFKREGTAWREYPLKGGLPEYEFRELYRTRDHINLQNLTPRPHAGWDTLNVRLPACEGTARITIGIPEKWEDLYQIWRE
jgi:hypothetical protein